MDRPVIKFRKLTASAQVPLRATEGAAAYDLYADQPIWLSLMRTRLLVSTGIAVQLPPGHVGLVCSRSGLAANNGVFVVNAPGIIDEDYTGEIKVILGYLEGNHVDPSTDYISLPSGSRIAQLLVMPRPTYDVSVVNEFVPTVRGAGGFGSTGVVSHAC